MLSGMHGPKPMSAVHSHLPGTFDGRGADVFERLRYLDRHASTWVGLVKEDE